MASVESQWDLDLKKFEKHYDDIEKEMFGGQYQTLMFYKYLNQGGLENNADFGTGIKYLVHDIVSKDLTVIEDSLNLDTLICYMSDKTEENLNSCLSRHSYFYNNYKFLKIFELIDKFNGRPGMDSRLELFQRDDFQIKNYFYEPFNVNLLQFALIFIFVSLFFKLALAPFHLWSPDIYEGSPTSSTFFFCSSA